MPRALLAFITSLSLIGSGPAPAPDATATVDEIFVLRVPVLTFHRVTYP